MSEHEPQHPDSEPAPDNHAPDNHAPNDRAPNDRASAPSPAPPGSGARRDWLHTVARATETVAPLVARQAPKPDDIPADRRGRLATLLAIAGILMAVLQFLVGAYDLFTRPLAPLAPALPYLAAGLLAAAGVFGLYTVVRARSPRHRLLALGSTLLVLLAALSWGGWLAYDALRPPAGYRILIGEFDGSKAGEYIDFGQRIAENLRRQLAAAGQPIEIKRTRTVFADAESARREGQNQKAGLVIWGWYDDRGVSPHVEVLSLPTSDAALPAIPILFATANAAAPGGEAAALQPVLGKLAPVTQTPLTLPSLDLFTAHGPDQMAYIASAVLAMSYLAQDDLTRALALFDQALASVAGDPAAAQGQEVVHFQRAGILYRLGRFAEARADLEAALALAPGYAPAQLLLAGILAHQCTPSRDLDAALAAAESAASAEPANVPAQQTLAELALRSGDPAGALAAAERARDLDPNQRATFTLLASIYTALGRDADSRAAAEEALALAQQEAGTQAAAPAASPAAGSAAAAPGAAAVPSADALYALGDAYLALDRYDEALAAYQQAQAAAPQDARLHLARGQVYFWQGALDGAAAEYSAWAQQAPDDPLPHTLLGIIYDQQGRASDALAAYARAAELSSCDSSVLLLLGAAQAEAGDLNAAQRTYARASEIDPHNPDVLFAAGANHLMLEDYVAAARDFALLVERRPQLVKAHYYLGAAYEGLGETTKAQAAYAEAARLAEELSPPPVDLAFAYEKLGRVDDAIAVYLRLLAQAESADLHAFLGALYAEKGADDLAQQEYARAVELDPQQTLARLALGNLAFAAGDWQAAAGHYEALLALEQSAAVHDYAAHAYLQLGDLAAAFRHLETATQLEESDAGLWQRLANTAYWLNRLDAAGTAVEQALRLKPDDPALYFTRGQLAYKRCAAAQAVDDLTRAVELAPDNPLYRGSLGGYYAAQGQWDALRPLVAQLQAAPADDYVAHWLAGSLLALDDGAAALAEYARGLQAADLPPSAAAALHTAAGSQSRLAGDLAAAREHYAQALALAPDYLDAAAGLGDLSWLAGDPAAAQEHYRRAVESLGRYAVQYSYDGAALAAPALEARLALVARALDDPAGEQAALAAAEAQLAALRRAAPEWPSVALLEGLLALVQGDPAAADAAFARAAACDQTAERTRVQIEALFGASPGASPGA